MRSVGLIAVPVLAVLGLLAGFALSLSAASRAFEHGLIAQRQAALVEAIAADADRLDQASLQRRLAAYRALVVEERPFLSAADAAAQGAEQRRAAALSALAGVAADRPRMAALVAAIAAEEAHEVAATRAGLARLRRNMVVLGALLAAAALGAVAAGALQMLRANRDLAGQVAERTAALEAVDASRRLFFAKASHELRTPVTAIRTIAEVAQEGADQAQALADIVAQAGFLEHRIADLMALAAAGEGQPALVLAPGDLAGVIAGAAAQAGPYARSLGVEIVVTAPAAPLIARIDGDRLAQALLAVIDNGLKFSDPGARLELALEAASGQAVLAVADSGPGVLPPELPRIFDAYYQAGAGRARGGSGLGLALARWVVERHGGTILAENRVGGGCRIVIGLPLVAEGEGQ